VTLKIIEPPRRLVAYGLTRTAVTNELENTPATMTPRCPV